VRRADVYPDAAVNAVASTAVVLMIVLAVLVLCAGCVPQEALEQARREQAINLGHSRDESLTTYAREIAQDNVDAWAAQAYSLGGDPLPPYVVERLRARGMLPEGWGE